MCLAQGPQRSDAGEARTRYPSVSSQALYHWATALPAEHMCVKYKFTEYMIVHAFIYFIQIDHVLLLVKKYGPGIIY